MSNTRGKCGNRKRCTTADSGRTIDVRSGTPFVCPECGGELAPFRATLRNPLPAAFVVFLALQVAYFSCMAWAWISRAEAHPVYASTATAHSNPEPLVLEPRERTADTSVRAEDARTHRGVVNTPPRSGVGKKASTVSSTSPEPTEQTVIAIRPPSSAMPGGENNCAVGTKCKAFGQAPAEEIPAPVVSELLADAPLRSGKVRDLVVASPAEMPIEEVRVSSGLSGGQIARRVTPVYPEQARTQKIQGTVVLAILIGEDGAVAQATPLSGPPVLVDAARQAVQQWRYTPFELNGKPLAMHSQVTVHFTLP